MNFGDFKQEWLHKMQQPIPTIDLYLKAQREAGLIKPASGRGNSASPIGFDDALNLSIALLVSPSPSESKVLVKAIRSAKVRRKTGPRNLTTEAELIRFGAKDESFPSVMRMLAGKLPTPENRNTNKEKEADFFSLSDFSTQYPLQILFHRGRAHVEVLQRTEAGLHGVELPPSTDVEWLNPKVGSKSILGRDSIERCDWQLLGILKMFLE